VRFRAGRKNELAGGSVTDPTVFLRVCSWPPVRGGAGKRAPDNLRLTTEAAPVERFTRFVGGPSRRLAFCETNPISPFHRMTARLGFSKRTQSRGTEPAYAFCETNPISPGERPVARFLRNEPNPGDTEQAEPALGVFTRRTQSGGIDSNEQIVKDLLPPREDCSSLPAHSAGGAHVQSSDTTGIRRSINGGWMVLAKDCH